MERRLELALLAAAAVLLAVALLGLPRCGGSPAVSPLRASWTLTPGVLNQAVTQSTIRSTICSHGWTRSIRPAVSYTNRLKAEGLRTYARVGGPSSFQEDHLVSLELGGDPSDPRNLWPEPRRRAEAVDRIENELNAAICSGAISLAEGQRRISLLKHTSG